MHCFSSECKLASVFSIPVPVCLRLHVNYIIIPTLGGDQEITLFKYRNLMNIHELCISQKRKCLLSDSSTVSGIMEKNWINTGGRALDGKILTTDDTPVFYACTFVYGNLFSYSNWTNFYCIRKTDHHGWQQTLNIHAFCIIHLFSNCIAEILSRLLITIFEVVSLYTANMNYFNSACNALFNCPTKIQQSAITVYD